MLNDINKWKTLKKLKMYNPFLYNGKESKYHYKVIQNTIINIYYSINRETSIV
jgi:hypothetical protein